MMRKAREMHLSFTPDLSDGAMSRLLIHNWPGNIREPDNLIERRLPVADTH